jgi:hypothetical protein
MINTLYISLNNIKEVVDEIKFELAIWPWNEHIKCA